ncbi:MAG: hypothetical protein JXO72_16555, partial [Vicinamibacteria bacterium]|nr:hypothetical protein [Vicinamibacteria bacterium]
SEEQLFGILRRPHAAYQGTRGLTTHALVETFSKETAGWTDAFFGEWLHGSTLPTVSVEWTARGMSASGRVTLDGTSLARHPLEMTFTRTVDERAESQRILISVGDTRFSFTLPFTPDTLAVDDRHLLLMREVKISRVAE